MTKPIIILGGMGPQASLRLHELIVKKSRAFHDGAPDSYPAITHLSIPAPDFIGSPERMDEALGTIRGAFESLETEKASAIGIACNTAHLLVDKLPLQETSFVSMIDAVVSEVEKSGAGKVGILASPQTIESGLYEGAFSLRGIESILPTPEQTLELDNLIHKIVAGYNPADYRDKLTEMAHFLESLGADLILLGCTELALVGLGSVNTTVVNSLYALADAMLNKHYSKQKLYTMERK